MKVIEPVWEAGARTRALATTRAGGASAGPWASFNLGQHCGDDATAVAENRRRLRKLLPADPCWLAQVHGTRVVHLDDWHAGTEADAAWTDRPGQVAVIQTADCLPVLIAHRYGAVVAAVHAGWRGLADGVIGKTVSALPGAREDLFAWIGPAICGNCYQVGDEVRDRFVGRDQTLAGAFRADGRHWRADLKAIAAIELGRMGVSTVDAGLCTSCEPARFFSFRRDGNTGRMASLIWLE